MIEKQCVICLKWREETKLEKGICRACARSINKMPDQIPIEYRKQHLKEAELNKKENRYGHLSKSDKAVFLRCSGCEWLRDMDYLNLKVYCSQPACQKGDG